MRSPCCLYIRICPCIHVSPSACVSPSQFCYEAYEITLLSVCPSHYLLVFYAVRVLTKGSRQLVLPRTYCFLLQLDVVLPALRFWVSSKEFYCTRFLTARFKTISFLRAEYVEHSTFFFF
jgi:hypothetical protein